MSYAETTKVPFERSVSEIITLIKRGGAMQIGQFEGDDFFAIQFKLADRLIRFHVPVPQTAATEAKLAQAHRQRGRALLLVIKAKLESVESGIETVEQAFLANVVMADGQTVWDRVARPIALEYEGGGPTPALGLLPPPK